jgi:hypothetical protein
MRDTPKQFDRLYQRLGFISESGEPIPLHSGCTHAKECWADAEARKPKDDDPRGTISVPWVGSRYEESRLLVVGENFDEYGGRTAFYDLLPMAMEGSVLWHRVGCIGYCFAQVGGARLAPFEELQWPAIEAASLGLEFIAFANHVKCSPKGGRSEQTAAMWKRCGSHVLRSEIDILRPKQIVILGRDDNRSSFLAQVASRVVGKTIAFGDVLLDRIDLPSGRRLNVFSVYHPSIGRGTKRSMLGNLGLAAVAATLAQEVTDT